MDENGKRFANKLGSRNYVVGERATANGEHCTGDGIKMGEAISEKSIDPPGTLATGGCGAGFTQQSLIAQYRPDMMHPGVVFRTVPS